MKNIGLKYLQISVGLIAIAAIIFGGYFYTKYQSVQKEIQTIRTDPNVIQKAAANETQKLIAKIGKLIELPKETPTVATITDASKLKDQPFFANGKNGDKVLIYTTAKKAILYSEALNKIVDVAPVSIGTASANPSPSPKL